jgi:hypothetical protein
MAIKVNGAPISMHGSLWLSKRVALLLTDGSVWQAENSMSVVGEKWISLRAAAWWLKQDRTSRSAPPYWRMISPPRTAMITTA